MSALTIYFIRHAEKPNGQWPGPGLTVEGTKDAKSLIIRGWQRAGAWATLFGAGLGQPDYLVHKPCSPPSREMAHQTKVTVGGRTKRYCRSLRDSG